MLINKNNKKGFTLIELLVVVAVLIIMASFVFPVFANMQGSTYLIDAKDESIQLLRMAQNFSCNGKDGINHGVYFDHNVNGNDRMIIFSGDSYALRDTTKDIETIFEGGVEITDTFNNNQILFLKNSCLADQSGILNINSDTLNRNINISINSLGVISE